MIKLLFNNSKKVLKISVNLSWLLVSEIYKNIISEKSIINFIIPVIENFLNYKNYIDYPTTDKKSKKNFIIKHKNETLKEIISSTQNLLPLIIEYPIDVKITKRILLFLYLNLKKISKNNNENNNANNDFVYTVDIFKMTNESLTIALNSIIKVYYNDIKYDEKLKKIILLKKKIEIKKLIWMLFTKKIYIF